MHLQKNIPFNIELRQIHAIIGYCTREQTSIVEGTMSDKNKETSQLSDFERYELQAKHLAEIRKAADEAEGNHTSNASNIDHQVNDHKDDVRTDVNANDDRTVVMTSRTPSTASGTTHQTHTQPSSHAVADDVKKQADDNALTTDDKPEKEPGLLDGLSVPQLAAGALAAVTSTFLSSQIGIAGSLIGVGVASVVSAVSSQVYKYFLNKSADKLKNVTPIYDPSATQPFSLPNLGRKKNDIETQADKTIVDQSLAAALRNGDVADGGTQRIAPDDIIASAQERHKQVIKRRVIIVAVISSLVAVAITACAITLFTGGNGIGPKTEPIFTQPTYSQRYNGNDNIDNQHNMFPMFGDGTDANESVDGENVNESDGNVNANENANEGIDGETITGTELDGETDGNDADDDGNANVNTGNDGNGITPPASDNGGNVGSETPQTPSDGGTTDDGSSNGGVIDGNSGTGTTPPVDGGNTSTGNGGTVTPPADNGATDGSAGNGIPSAGAGDSSASAENSAM